MVRDANRFHHFEDGVCSCMDADSLSCQSLYHAHFVCRSSTLIIVPP
jgi:hypothetical protein